MQSVLTKILMDNDYCTVSAVQTLICSNNEATNAIIPDPTQILKDHDYCTVNGNSVQTLICNNNESTNDIRDLTKF